MKIRSLSMSIKRRKMLLNFLLKYFSPSNFFLVKLSQDLDKHIVNYQYYLSRKYKRKMKSEEINRLIA